MLTDLLKIISIPFLGTVLGAAAVFVLRKGLKYSLARFLNGFASGIMIAASVWSLIIPAIALAEEGVLPSYMPAVIGLWSGIISFYLLNKLLLNKYNSSENAINKSISPITVLAITLHNIPEGMALGVIFAAWASGGGLVGWAAVMTLAIGIGAQNVPEGCIISLPLYANGRSKLYAFGIGVISAIAEALGSVLTLIAAPFISAALPYLMCFAAGAMIYVVVCELCPEMSTEKGEGMSVLPFALGFSVMMVLDVALG